MARCCYVRHDGKPCTKPGTFKEVVCENPEWAYRCVAVVFCKAHNKDHFEETKREERAETYAKNARTQKSKL